MLGRLWQRAYRLPQQKWELATAAFEHLTHCVSLLDHAAEGPGAPAPESLPGLATLYNISDSGNALQVRPRCDQTLDATTSSFRARVSAALVRAPL